MHENLLKTDLICCLIITYNPDDRLLNLINTINRQGCHIIIVDNSSSNGGLAIINSIENQYDVNIIKNDNNLGIATALNQGVKEAIKCNFDFVLTFDQDSTPFDNIISVIKEVYDSYPFKYEIGAIGVSYESLFVDRLKGNPQQEKYLEKDYLITSGCLLCVKSFIEIGGFREDFFIDNVDIEYSLRLTKNGKKSLFTIKPGMIHKAGEPLIKKILGFNIISSNHNSFRRYFMSRNHVIVTRDYFFTNPYFILKLNFFYILSIIKMLIVEKDRKSKLKRSFKGFKDAFNLQLLSK